MRACACGAVLLHGARVRCAPCASAARRAPKACAWCGAATTATGRDGAPVCRRGHGCARRTTPGQRRWAALGVAARAAKVKRAVLMGLVHLHGLTIAEAVERALDARHRAARKRAA